MTFSWLYILFVQCSIVAAHKNITFLMWRDDMKNVNVDLLTEYNTKAMESLRAFGDLNVANTQWVIEKQLELSNSLMEAGLATQKDLTSVKSPAEALQNANSLMQTWAENMTGFVKESNANVLKSREDLKAVIEDVVNLNTEYATKAYEAGVAEVKKATK